jgi:hypothetical protein
LHLTREKERERDRKKKTGDAENKKAQENKKNRLARCRVPTYYNQDRVKKDQYKTLLFILLYCVARPRLAYIAASIHCGHKIAKYLNLFWQPCLFCNQCELPCCFRRWAQKIALRAIFFSAVPAKDTFLGNWV